MSNEGEPPRGQEPRKLPLFDWRHEVERSDLPHLADLISEDAEPADVKTLTDTPFAFNERDLARECISGGKYRARHRQSRAEKGLNTSYDYSVEWRVAGSFCLHKMREQGVSDSTLEHLKNYWIFLKRVLPRLQTNNRQ